MTIGQSGVAVGPGGAVGPEILILLAIGVVMVAAGAGHSVGRWQRWRRRRAFARALRQAAARIEAEKAFGAVVTGADAPDQWRGRRAGRGF